MTAADLADRLTVIADMTKALRDAGVVGRVEVVGVVSFEIGEAMAPAGPASTPAVPQNPLDDPDTFGGHIPQRRVRNDEPPAPTETDDD